MSGELEALLRLVAEGKLTAEEAAPLVAALQERDAQPSTGEPQRPAGEANPAGTGAGAGEPSGASSTAHRRVNEARDRAWEARDQAHEARDRAHEARDRRHEIRDRHRVANKQWWRVGAAGEDARREQATTGDAPRVSAREALEGRRLRIRITEEGRSLINLQMPLAAAGAALDRIPGLSPDDRRRIVDAIRSGMTGPILDVRDDADEVLIVIE